MLNGECLEFINVKYNLMMYIKLVRIANIRQVYCEHRLAIFIKRATKNFKPNEKKRLEKETRREKT